MGINIWGCHTSEQEATDYASSMDLIRKSGGLESRHIGPGGVELGFKFGRVVLPSECNSCALEILKAFLAEHGIG